MDDDRRLTWREDRRFWGSSRFQFVTVRVPVNATKATILKAVNAQRKRMRELHRKQAKAAGAVRTTITSGGSSS